MRGDIFVSCFSKKWNSLLMWAHYARNYNGYCIEYDVTKIKDYMIYNLYPVLYEKEYIDITESLINYNKNTGLICNLIKAKEWKYEKEWRIVEYRENPFYFKKALKVVYLGKNCAQKIKEDILQWAKNDGKEVYVVEASGTKY